MKKIYILSLLFISSVVANAQLQEEDFNARSLPVGWKIDQSNSHCSWKFGYTDNLPFIHPINPKKMETGSLLFDDNACGSFKNNVIAIESPEIDLISKRVVNASIEVTYNHQAFVNSGIFKIDAWNGSNWENIHLSEVDSPSKQSQETSLVATIDISDHINDSFKVRFVYDDENSRAFGVAIDHYKLINTNEALTEELADNDFVYFPNPVNDDLNIIGNKKIKNVTVFNSIGQLMLRKQPNELNTKIALNSLSSGVYLVQLEMGDATENFKVYKK